MASPLYAEPSGKRFLLLLGATLILQHGITVHGAGPGNSSLALPNCPDKCGNVSIPYPFGIGQGCFLQQDFAVRCENGRASIRTGEDKGVYSEVFDFDLLNGEARIQNSVDWSCNYTNNTKDHHQASVSLSLGDSLKVSYTKNKFTGIGCATVAIIVGSRVAHMNGNNWHYTSACSSFCDSLHSISKSSVCDGVGCCQTSIAANLSEFRFGFFHNDALLHNPYAQPFSPCSYAFVVETNSFKFDPSYAQSSNFKKQGVLPLVLDWRVSNETCNKAKKKLSLYACRANNSVCISTTNSPGYRCNCSPGYEGNPYLAEGCQDINECDSPFLFPCNGTCTNTIGSYSCSCPPGTQSKDPVNEPCSPIPGSNRHQVQVVIGTFLGFLFLIVCIFALLIKCQKRKLAKEKQRFFKQNGGHILYQQILSKQIDTVIIFTIEDLKKATNNFDRSREIGIGGHGTVYKGILCDNKVVAVKRSKIINVTQTEEFVQEIIILSQINHRNVVRLLGCCLEVEVPILVYEYIPNGTLFELIHDDRHDSLPAVSLEDRLRIAQESAEALEYLHLSINRPIVHGDVKSLNILLDDNYMAKVTDFGASRMLPKDAVQFMTMVQGTLGYLDPEYLQERKLTEKSDVYSFGVVLLELITRKTAIYFEGSEVGKYLASSFLRAMNDYGNLEGMLDTSILGVGMEELFQEVAELASQCLSFKGEDRPSMTQVADKLKAIRSNWREILLLKHEETNKRAVEGLGMASTCGSITPSVYWTAQMSALNIEAPRANYAGSTNMA
ncbi:unnamed protein product [Urochloa decumbens]|uniref:Uncharacterized protein n=1 Tax=Urochloa decumbens TaxID=240449 RepID=A0ABC9E4Q9_9POAL